MSCSCPGKYYDKWHRWAVLDRQSVRRSLLYCKECRGVWRSKAKYVVLLPDHSPESRRGMTDEEILERVNDGSLVVDVENAMVESITHCGRRQLRVVERESQGSRYRFVEVCHRGKKKKIALHRLVWIAANLRLPPPGYDVDHMHSQEDDTIGNLRLLRQEVNRSETARTTVQHDSEF